MGKIPHTPMNLKPPGENLHENRTICHIRCRLQLELGSSRFKKHFLETSRHFQRYVTRGKSTLRFEWDQYRWPQRSPSRSKFKVKLKIPYKSVIWIRGNSENQHLGVNRRCDFNLTNIDDLRGHLQGQSSSSNWKYHINLLFEIEGIPKVCIRG